MVAATPIATTGGTPSGGASQVYQPMTGESPLDSMQSAGIDPNNTGKGGSLQTANILAWNDFVKQFGRNPSQSELNMIAPAYQSGDPNIANRGQGQQYLAQYYSSLANTPANVYSRQQQQWSGRC